MVSKIDELKKVGEIFEKHMVRDTYICNKTFTRDKSKLTIGIKPAPNCKTSNYETVDMMEEGKLYNGFFCILISKTEYTPSGYAKSCKDGGYAFEGGSEKYVIEVDFPGDFKNWEKFLEWCKNIVNNGEDGIYSYIEDMTIVEEYN